MKFKFGKVLTRAKHLRKEQNFSLRRKSEEQSVLAIQIKQSHKKYKTL